MGVHPNKHMSLEEVRRNNPEFYESLLVHRAEQRKTAPRRPSPTKSLAPNVGSTSDMLKTSSAAAAPAVADPAAVLQILQNLKGLTKAASTSSTPVAVSVQKG